MAATLKIILAVGGIFVAGAVTGGFVGVRIAERIARDQRAQQRMGPTEIGGRLAEQLNLTPEQREKLRPIVGRTTEELRNVRRESFNQMTALVLKMDADMSKFLTEEQRVRLVEIRAKEEERRQKWQAERNERSKRNEPGAPGGPPGEKLPPPGNLPERPPARTP
jgi:Spy/CpxP family protein refolding chaperone